MKTYTEKIATVSIFKLIIMIKCYYSCEIGFILGKNHESWGMNNSNEHNLIFFIKGIILHNLQYSIITSHLKKTELQFNLWNFIYLKCVFHPTKATNTHIQ